MEPPLAGGRRRGGKGGLEEEEGRSSPQDVGLASPLVMVHVALPFIGGKHFSRPAKNFAFFLTFGGDGAVAWRSNLVNVFGFVEANWRPKMINNQHWCFSNK
jgi:hypothetical protein